VEDKLDGLATGAMMGEGFEEDSWVAFPLLLL
jgi:hypothetical protein